MYAYSQLYSWELLRKTRWSRSSLKTGPARPGHVKIALDIVAVNFDQFSIYSTGTMIIYDRLSL